MSGERFDRLPFMRPTDYPTPPAAADPPTGPPDAPATDPDRPTPPAVGGATVPGSVGGFRVDRVLGRGGMGVVYVAHDPHLGRLVAVKVMRPDLATAAAHRERFLREARAAGGLHHDHIMPVYQAGEAGGELFLVMPLLCGWTLEERLKAGPVPPVEAVEVCRQAALGLAAAHEAGLVHRDVKPANLFLENRPDGVRVRLLDFGIARSATDSGLTGPGGVGTPAYMAPEQRAGQPADHRADLFALGCVLGRLCGSRPPAGPAGLIRRLTAADPADRPASAEAVAAELAAVAADLARPPRRRWRAGAAVAAGLLALGGLLLAQVVIRVERDGKATVLTVPDGSTVTVPPAGPITVQPPPVATATDFDVLLDADLDGLTRWADGLRGRGLRPADLSAWGAGGGRFTAVAVAADGREWELVVAPTAAAYKAAADRLTAARYQAVARTNRLAAGEAVPVSLWVRPGLAPWTADRYTTLAALTARIEATGKRNGRPARLTATRLAGVTYYSLVTARNVGRRDCRWRADLSRAGFDAEHADLAARGYRLDGVDAGDGPDGLRVHAVWVKDGRPSDFALDLTREQLDRQLADRQAARSRPHTLSAYDTPAGLRFAVTWEPQPPPPELAPMPRPAAPK
jgi:hypothetical protein